MMVSKFSALMAAIYRNPSILNDMSLSSDHNIITDSETHQSFPLTFC